MTGCFGEVETVQLHASNLTFEQSFELIKLEREDRRDQIEKI